jgi:hypothetical protein
MRRLLAAAAAALALAAATATAGADTGGEQWAGSGISATATGGSIAVQAFFDHAPDRTIRIRVSITGGPGLDGCPLPADVASDATVTPKAFATSFSVACNGTYGVTAFANTTNNDVYPRDDASRSQVLDVSMPAPTVTGVEATADGRRITVRWDDMRSAAPDVAAYTVERSIDGADFAELTTVEPARTTVTDTDLPPTAGSAAYRVAAVRPAPDGTKVSAASVPTVTPYPAAPMDPATGQPVPNDAPPADTDTGSAGSAGGGATRPSRSAGPGGGVTLPRIGISGSFFPPLLQPKVDVGATTSTTDAGFGEELPYDPATDGAPDGDELALLEEEGTTGRGMVIPVATALVLAVWALHLRMLARAARPIA